MIEPPAGLVLRKDTKATLGALDKSLKAMLRAVRGGDSFKCFNAEDWGTMGDLVIDYRWFGWDYSLNLEYEIRLRELEVEKLELRVIEWKDYGDRADQARRDINKAFDMQQEFLESMERRDKAKTVLLGGAAVAGVIAVITMGIIIASGG